MSPCFVDIVMYHGRNKAIYFRLANNTTDELTVIAL